MTSAYADHLPKIRTMKIQGTRHSAYDAQGNYLCGGQASAYAYALAHWVFDRVSHLTVLDLNNYSVPPITGEVPL